MIYIKKVTEQQGDLNATNATCNMQHKHHITSCLGVGKKRIVPETIHVSRTIPNVRVMCYRLDSGSSNPLVKARSNTEEADAQGADSE